MKAKLEQGAYPGWVEFWDDMALMFRNALMYNAPNDKIHQAAAKLRKIAWTIANKVRAPSKTGGANATKRAAAAKKAAQAKSERDAAARAARQQQKLAQEQKVLRKAGVAEDGDDLEARATYKSAASNPLITIWGGLAGGLSGQGVAWAYGRPTLKPSNPVPLAEGYASSMLRFAAGLTGRARELVMAKIQAAKSAAENVTPPEKPVAAPVQQTKGGKGSKKQQQAAQGGQQQAVRAPQKSAAMSSQFSGTAPMMGVLPPVAPLAGVGLPQTAPGALGSIPGMAQPAAGMMNPNNLPNAATMAAQNAKLLATQTQAHVAPGGGMAMPTTMPMSMPMASFPGGIPGMPQMAMMPNFAFPGMQMQAMQQQQQQSRPMQGILMPPGVGQFPQFTQQGQFPQVQQQMNSNTMGQQQMGVHNGLLFQPPQGQ